MFRLKNKKSEPDLPDWLETMNRLYENPNDWSSDNKMVQEYTCENCGAPFQRKTICEYCSSRNERAKMRNYV